METLVRRFADFEVRNNEEEKESRHIEGVAVVFNQRTDLGWFTEEIDNHAFDDAIKDDVVLNLNHDDSLLLAGTRNGSLQFDITESDVPMSADIVETTTGNDVLKLVREKLITKMSFAFTVDYDDPDAIEWIDKEGEKSHRIVRKIKQLYDLSLVTFPAYEQTSVSARSMADDPSAREHKALLERRAEQTKRMEELFNG